jgi:hypothetical protein
VGAFFDDPAFFQDVYPVGVPDCGEAMRNQENSDGAWHLGEGFVDAGFGLAIQGGGGLIQDE